MGLVYPSEWNFCFTEWKDHVMGVVVVAAVVTVVVVFAKSSAAWKNYLCV